MKQTAIQWLVSIIESEDFDETKWDEYVMKARHMEDAQIAEALNRDNESHLKS